MTTPKAPRMHSAATVCGDCCRLAQHGLCCTACALTCRACAQVLAIQYGGNPLVCGGFFPSCVNGKIQG